MTDKQRAHAALEGRPVDRCPVTALYSHLYHMDHFEELTGLPQWKAHQWRYSAPEDYLSVFKQIYSQAPFEMLQMMWALPRQERERQEFVEKDGRPFRHDKKTDEWFPLDTNLGIGHAIESHANETQYVFDKKDVDEKVKVWKAEDAIACGASDYIEAVVGEFGKERFIISGGLVGTFWSCTEFVGLTNLFSLIIEKPRLIEYLSKKIQERQMEHIRQLAAAGGDAIFIDDATTTCDMISVAHYERFSLPYMKAMVDEIHRLGHKAILIYFGGIGDRLEQVASIGADGLQMEASMKGYVNDIAATTSAIGRRITLFSNINPVEVLQDGTDEELEAEIRRQVVAGVKGRGFVIAPSSPITPRTPLSRVQKFIQLARDISSAAYASA